MKMKDIVEILHTNTNNVLPSKFDNRSDYFNIRANKIKTVLI